MIHFNLNDIDVEDLKSKGSRNLNILEIDFDSNIFP